MKYFLLVVIFTTFGAFHADAAEEASERVFVRRVAPLLREKCLACHGQDATDIQGGLDLRTAEAALKGGDSGQPAFIAGKPAESPLYLAVTRTHDEWQPMPPKEADKLYAAQVGWLKDWIENGAAWPDEARAREIAKANEAKWSAEDGVVMRTSGALSPEWGNRRYQPADVWAYQPVKEIQPPTSDGNPIDAFLSEKMPAGLKPAPTADRITLLRRATFDLIGLPPTPEEVTDFVNDSLSDAEAFNKVIERLLASPHYGERMAQHWLDVTRYADSSGFSNDFERGNAWRYRDYVVRSFNRDKPYDQFVLEQIAGDEIDPNNPDMLVATGFLRMGPWELTAMEVPKIARQRFLDDVTNSVGETFLAHSLQCARCHDHKFDPVPTRDYYAIQAVFATTQLTERPASFLPEENTDGFDEKKFLEQRRADHLATLKLLDEKELRAAEAWYSENNLDPTKWMAAVEQAQRRDGKWGTLFDEARVILIKKGESEDLVPPRNLGLTTEESGLERVAAKGLERLQWEFDRYKPIALSVYDGRTPQVTSVNAPFRMPANRMTSGDLEETCILTGGDPFAGGEKVQPGVLSVLASAQKTPIPDAIEGRRKAFAEWIANSENPLTTRSIANRIWLWHFNQSIAGNPNNFGATGKKPTHPELLDWLAATFVRQGWSFKAMHRLMMGSDAYRRGALHPDRESLARLDPEGASNATFRPRRLTAEELRDCMLAATGELNPALGGVPNRPEINLEVAMQPRQVMGTFASAWTPNPLPQDRHRRSLYAQKIRGLRDPFFEVFDAPSPDFSCEIREAATIAPQVFSLFNGQASYSRALALANRAVRETQSDEQALARCFVLAFSREPTVDELQTCLEHWRSIESLLGADVTAPPSPPLVVRRDGVSENTGGKFSFDEKLYANTEFVPDLQPADAPAHTRALADVCLALFNSNEFAYVY